MLTALTGVACSSADEPSYGTAEQPIYYGSRAPSVVSLTAGEKLAIGYLSDPYGNPFCSGTLIDRDVVVTAEHCTTGSNANSIRFGVGTPEQPDAIFQVQSIREHSSRDVALLFLTEDAVSRVPRIEPLPFLRQALPNSMIGSRVEAAGYGQTHDNSTGRYFAALTLSAIDDTFYTVDGGGQRGICFGDSGGPLLVSVSGNTVVAGVESNGDSSCVDVDHLTRLDRVQDWIDSSNGDFNPNDSGQSWEDTDKPPVDGGQQTTGGNSTTGKPPGDQDTGSSTSTGSTGKPPVQEPGQETGQDVPSGDSEEEPSQDDGPLSGPIFTGCSAAQGGSIDAAWLALVPLFIGMVRRRRAARS